VYQGNVRKFRDEHARRILLETKGLTLVEASPYDTIWGVGLGEHHRDLLSRRTWRGLNWLGEVLTAVRYSIED
jgi:ribA/ribD-fused uncharacterized protein